MLRSEPSRQNVEVEGRLFSQLMQCCIRARQGRKAIDVYEMMMAHSTPSASFYISMFDTAAEILEIAAAKGGRVDAQDANMVLSGAAKKQKTACVTTITAAMAALGLPVDPLV